MTFKPSRYNKFFKEKDSILLFNSFSKACIKIDKDDLIRVEAILNKKDECTGKDKDYQDEINALESYLKLINKHKNIKTKLKSEKQNLDKKIKDKYSNLNNKEIISLVVEKKWIAVLSSNLDEELINIFKILTKRLNILAERYSKSYPIMLKNLSNATEVVEKHLKKMGFK